MKVLSLMQPWATLVVIGAKKIETRSWNTKFRGPLLIHASAAFSKQNKAFTDQICNEKYGLDLGSPDKLPTGAIIGGVDVCDVTSLNKVDVNFTFNVDLSIKFVFESSNKYWQVTEAEFEFGDYSENRFGWLLENNVEFTTPIQCKRALSIWTLPRELEPAVNVLMAAGIK